MSIVNYVWAIEAKNKRFSNESQEPMTVVAPDILTALKLARHGEGIEVVEVKRGALVYASLVPQGPITALKIE